MQRAALGEMVSSSLKGLRRVAEEFDGVSGGEGVVDWTAIFVGFLDEIWETICNLGFLVFRKAGSY